MKFTYSRIQFFFFVFYLLFGYFLADLLPFSYIDELCELFFLFLLIICKRKKREFVCFFSLFFFFVLYSSIIKSNIYIAILLDALQQAKPFIFFYFGYSFAQEFSSTEKKIIQTLSLSLAYTSFVIGTLLDPTYSSGLFHHPTNYGMSMFSYAIIYYYYSDLTKKELFHFLVIASLGLLCGRSKYASYYICSVFLVFFVENKIKLSIKYILCIFFLVCIIVYVAQDKIIAYTNEDALESQARTVLYLNSLPILFDYLPFGSGLASYATWFSGIYYSSIYSKYGIDSVFGLEDVNGIPDAPNFIADTYFPCLVQVGVIGILFFILFWIRRYKEIGRLYDIDVKLYKTGMIICAYSFIESLASPMLVTSYSLIPLFILGSITSKCSNI